MRKLFKAKLAALGMLALMLLVAVMLAAPLGGVATRDAGPIPTRTPTMTVAEVVRGEALRACSAGEWDRCLGRLEEARKLDPAGDEAAEVHAARSRALEALDAQEREMEAKPRP